jgi:hypothetical protein
MGCSCRYHRGGPVRRRSLTSLANIFLTILQRRLGCEIGSSQGTLSLTRLQALWQLHLVNCTVTDRSYRCCNELLQTTGETNYNLLLSWNLLSNMFPQCPSWIARHSSQPLVRTRRPTSTLVQQQATSESTDGILSQMRTHPTDHHQHTFSSLTVSNAMTVYARHN